MYHKNQINNLPEANRHLTDQLNSLRRRYTSPLDLVLTSTRVRDTGLCLNLLHLPHLHHRRHHRILRTDTRIPEYRGTTLDRGTFTNHTLLNHWLTESHMQIMSRSMRMRQKRNHTRTNSLCQKLKWLSQIKAS